MTISLIQGAALLLSLIAVALALRLAFNWRHDRGRTMLAAIGVIAVLANAAVLGLELMAGQAGTGWEGPLRLIPQIGLPVIFLLLLRTLRRRDAQAREAAREAPFDRITGLPNLPVLQRQIIPALARCRREGSPATLFVTGIDGFAAIRAQRGPAMAAEMLRSLAAILHEATRGGDLSGHVEPGLLATLLPDATNVDAEGIAERLRALASERMVNPEMTGRRVTVSIGIAMVGDGAEPAALEEAISAARAAFRSAVAEGGNSTRMAPRPPARSAYLPA